MKTNIIFIMNVMAHNTLTPRLRLNKNNPQLAELSSTLEKFLPGALGLIAAFRAEGLEHLDIATVADIHSI